MYLCVGGCLCLCICFCVCEFFMCFCACRCVCVFMFIMFWCMGLCVYVRVYVSICLCFCVCVCVCKCVCVCVCVRGGADKSLSRSGRKQATATKFGIYSTYSPRNSIHFLALCSNFPSHSKKFRTFSVQPGLRGRNDLRVGPKMANF